MLFFSVPACFLCVCVTEKILLISYIIKDGSIQMLMLYSKKSKSVSEVMQSDVIRYIM